MRNLVATLLVASVTLAFAQKPSADPKAEQAVREHMNQFAKAVLGKDKATLEKLMAESILYSHSNGTLDTRAQFINNVMTENPKYEGFDYGEQKIVVYGNTVIVRGKITVKDLLNGQRRTLELNALQVWIKGGQDWTMVARQSTRMNP